MRYLKFVVPLFIAYLALTQNLQLSNLVVGLALSVAIAMVMQPGSATLRPSQWSGAIWAIVQHTFLLLIDVVKCGIGVARIVIDPKLPIKPGIVAVKPHSRNTAVIALSAHAITITPGEQVIEIGKDGTMYTHCLDAETSGKTADGAQAARLKLLQRIFGN